MDKARLKRLSNCPIIQAQKGGTSQGRLFDVSTPFFKIHLNGLQQQQQTYKMAWQRMLAAEQQLNHVLKILRGLV